MNLSYVVLLVTQIQRTNYFKAHANDRASGFSFIIWFYTLLYGPISVTGAIARQCRRVKDVEGRIHSSVSTDLFNGVKFALC